MTKIVSLQRFAELVGGELGIFEGNAEGKSDGRSVATAVMAGTVMDGATV